MAIGDEFDGVIFHIDVCELCEGQLTVAGWIFHRDKNLKGVALREGNGSLHVLECGPSPDVAAVHGERASNARFHVAIGSAAPLEQAILEATFKDGAFSEGTARIPVLDAFRDAHDPYHQLFQEFCNKIHALEAPVLLELGGRARRGTTIRETFKEHVRYKSMDIVAGENVDIVGDAHALSGLVPHGSFDAIFSLSVFEHLAMPWKVAIEMNKVLKPGGLVFIATHQTWPVHDAPWDFWRFSDSAWPSLFNEATGFRVLKSAMGLPATIRARSLTRGTFSLEDEPAYLGSSVMVEKTGPTSLTWPVDLAVVTKSVYPA